MMWSKKLSEKRMAVQLEGQTELFHKSPIKNSFPEDNEVVPTVDVESDRPQRQTHPPVWQ